MNTISNHKQDATYTTKYIIKEKIALYCKTKKINVNLNVTKKQIKNIHIQNSKSNLKKTKIQI